MNHFSLLLYPALLLAAVGYKARLAGKGRFSEAYMEPDQTKMIQAAACIGVILHHLTQQVTGYGVVSQGPVTLFNYIGFLFTSLFFFFSGYGLITRFYTKPDYLRFFLLKRLPSVLIPFWVINLLRCLSDRFIYGTHESFGEILRDTLGITLGSSNSWFIIEIVILYLAFYVLFSLIPDKDLALVLLWIVVAVLIIFGFLRGHDPEGSKGSWFRGEWWYNSTIAFILGTLYGRCRKKADLFIQKRYALLLAAGTILMVASVHISIFMVRRFGYYREGFSDARRSAALTLLSQSAACGFFVVFILLVSMKITLGNRAIRYLSGIRAELFLVHGYFVSRVFGNVRLAPFVRYAVVISCSILCTAVLAPGIQWLSARMIAFLTPGKEKYTTLESEIAEQKRRKRFRMIGFVAGTGLLLYSFFFFSRILGPRLFAEKEYKEECEAIRSAAVGDEVLWGRFETDRSRIGKERLSWIVIAREEERIGLLSRYGIAGSFYHQKHEEVSWEESDLHTLLNSEEFLKIFNKYELRQILETDGDLITLLTVEEAAGFFEDEEDRELAITSAAEQDGTNINRLSKDNNWDMKGYRSSWWWLRGEAGEKSITAPIVSVDGEILLSKKAVNKPGGAIRPVIWVKLTDHT